MKILAIYHGHNATAALLVDGKVVFCQSEERMNRLKNSTGFPAETVSYIQKTYGTDFDLVVFPQKDLAGYAYLRAQEKPAIRYQNYFKDVRPRDWRFACKYLAVTLFPRLTSSFITHKSRRYDAAVERDAWLRAERSAYFTKMTGVTEDKLRFLDHHQSHAYSLGFLLDPEKKTLIFTLDGEGDDTCATVSIWDQGALTELSRTQKMHSIGYYYLEMTGFLGMKPNEDEFKLMGLAPYAKQESSRVREVRETLESMLRIGEDGSFVSTVPPGLLRYHFFKHFSYTRFDHLAAGMQQFLEARVLEWVRYWTTKAQIQNIGVSGGVFMNVKLNEKLMHLPGIESVVAMPSAADESTVFGCLYAGYRELVGNNGGDANRKQPGLSPLTNLYLGTTLDDKELATYLSEHPELGQRYRITQPKNLTETLADILANGGIIARASGRMEWGARGLGNRSIIADPRSTESVRVINEMIKNRDFWMPFAPSVLEEDFSRYFKASKKDFSPYMIFGFAATAAGIKDLPAALHTYDFSGRPQVVRKSWNPEYHALISAFKKKTGVGGVLNTSFNLHGHPVARTVADAFEVMDNSHLPHLVIGSYLISRT